MIETGDAFASIDLSCPYTYCPWGSPTAGYVNQDNWPDVLIGFSSSIYVFWGPIVGVMGLGEVDLVIELPEAGGTTHEPTVTSMGTAGTTSSSAARAAVNPLTTTKGVVWSTYGRTRRSYVSWTKKAWRTEPSPASAATDRSVPLMDADRGRRGDGRGPGAAGCLALISPGVGPDRPRCERMPLVARGILENPRLSERKTLISPWVSINPVRSERAESRRHLPPNFRQGEVEPEMCGHLPSNFRPAAYPRT